MLRGDSSGPAGAGGLPPAPAGIDLGRWFRVLSLALAGSVVAFQPSQAGFGGIDASTGRTRLEVNFRYTPSYQQVVEVQAALARASGILCDATDGQVRISDIRLTTSPVDEDLAALWLHPTDARSGGPYHSDGSGLVRLGSHLDVFGVSQVTPDHLAHLLAHHVFGLGDQYAAADRDDQACGVGSGFEAGTLDERSHSLMQAAGGMHCVDRLGQQPGCLRDQDCGGVRCEARLASEFSVASNHDPVRGEGGICPRSRPLSRVRLRGLLPRTARPIGPFDATSFLTARATSSFVQRILAVDEEGAAPGVPVRLYLSHVDTLRWQLTAAVDAGLVGSAPGGLHVLDQRGVTFNTDGSLNAVEGDGLLRIPPTTVSQGEIVAALDVGTTNRQGPADSGLGYDGLQSPTAGSVQVTLDYDGSARCGNPHCAQAWNMGTGDWEISEQSLLHEGRSDWETIHRNYPFLVPPPGLPVEAAPALCDEPPIFVQDVVGRDQLLLVLDASQSMGEASDRGIAELCDNSIDDDANGLVDEEECSRSRLAFEKAAARVFLDLHRGSGVEVGLLIFDSGRQMLADIAGLNPSQIERILEGLEALDVGADSAIGAAIEASYDAFESVRSMGRSRTAILISDGFDNTGIEPASARRPFRGGVRWFTVPVGASADKAGMAQLAADSGGGTLAVQDAAGLPAALAELASRYRGETLAVPRSRFSLARKGAGRERARGTDGISENAAFDIRVEEGAQQLTVVLASRQADVEKWNVAFQLSGPGGERYDYVSAETVTDPYYHLVRIPSPRPGLWSFDVLPLGDAVQHGEVVVAIDNDEADFVVDARPRLARIGDPVRISAAPVFVANLADSTAVMGSVARPDGTTSALLLERDPLTGAWEADFEDFRGRGDYEVTLTALVGDSARSGLGEPVFPGAVNVPVRVPSFERVATTSFCVVDGDWPVFRTGDCDGDGIADAVEDGCVEDVDEDGIPNRHDTDADNDEVSDRIEGVGDSDGDGVPDFCDPKDAPKSLRPVIDHTEAAIRSACTPSSGDSVVRLNAATAALRRIAQTLRAFGQANNAAAGAAADGLSEALKLNRRALVVAAVLPDFCTNYQATLQRAVELEKDLISPVDALLAR